MFRPQCFESFLTFCGSFLARASSSLEDSLAEAAQGLISAESFRSIGAGDVFCVLGTGG